MTHLVPARITPPRTTAPRITTLRVVVPAHDEEESLPGHLADLSRAVHEVGTTYPAVDVEVLLVLDDCRDSSSAIAAAWPSVRAITIAERCVGRARRVGIQAARSASSASAATWVACTDADSRVPHDWLVRHLEQAEQGADLVLGTVRPDLCEQRLLRAWHARHTLADGHDHVHGANMSFRLSAYDAVGGFAEVSTGEDVALAAAIRGAGFRARAISAAPVETSARQHGRAPRGFAAYLVALSLATDT